MRYHFIPIRMVTILKEKKKENNQCWQGRGETGTFMHCW